MFAIIGFVAIIFGAWSWFSAVAEVGRLRTVLLQRQAEFAADVESAKDQQEMLITAFGELMELEGHLREMGCDMSVKGSKMLARARGTASV